MRYLGSHVAAVVLLLLTACGDHGHHDDHGGGHDDHGGGHDDHGGGHDDHGGGGDELPGQSVTDWGASSELFMEWDPLIVGGESRFLAHVTVMPSFDALLEGTVTVSIAMADGAPLVVSVDAPARPGIFIPVVTPARAGPCTMTVDIKSPKLSDRYQVKPCVVYADKAAARAALPADQEPSGRISFLKEQQWPIAFGTGVVQARELQPSLSVNAEIRTMPGRQAHLTAATGGRLSLASPPPELGAAVAKGDLLAQIQPVVAVAGNYGALRAEVDATRAEYEAAVAKRDRLAGLVADKAVPQRRLDDAMASAKVAKARLNAAKTRVASYNASASGAAARRAGAFRIRAPISGTLVDVSVTEGETVSAGAKLFEVIDLSHVWVEGKVYEPDIPKIEHATTAWFTVEGRDTVFEISESTGRLVTVGHVIDSRSRTVRVVFSIANPAAVLRVGQYAKLSVATGPAMSVLAVPESALLSDGGQWIAFVQVDGEGFVRRVVRRGIRSRGWVQVVAGLAEGEHVVTRGAYDVKRAASASDAPAHGHAH